MLILSKWGLKKIIFLPALQSAIQLKKKQKKEREWAYPLPPPQKKEINYNSNFKK